MGSGGFTIPTSSPEAQLWFDYGIKLYHGFYHEEAKKAFDRAFAADPKCAMCAWGQALAHGPTMNYDVEADEIAKGRVFADTAAKLAGDIDPKNRALISALQIRYASKAGDNAGYTKAMNALAAKYPDDAEVAVLTVHAELLEAARKYAFDSVQHSVQMLEAVLAKRPNDTAAIHYYIHATEFVGEAPKALPYAEKLAKLAPDASHLVHMAAHTLIHVGRYEDVANLNAEAIAVDARFDNTMGYRRALGSPLYYPHNFGFGLAGAMLAGDRDLSLKYASHAAIAFKEFPADRKANIAGRTYAALGRYDPAKALTIPEDPAAPYLMKAMRHYARGEAFAAQGDAAAVLAEAKAIDKLPRSGARDGAANQGDLASRVLEGRALMLQGKPEKAAKVFEKAAKIQDKVFGDNYDPPPWWYPIRRSAAAARLKAGDAKAAQALAEESLKGWPNDALALMVKSQAERAQGQAAQADADLAQARKVWRGDLAKIGLDAV
jgi:hypothetical protein